MDGQGWHDRGLMERCLLDHCVFVRQVKVVMGWDEVKVFLCVILFFVSCVWRNEKKTLVCVSIAATLLCGLYCILCCISGSVKVFWLMFIVGTIIETTGNECWGFLRRSLYFVVLLGWLWVFYSGRNMLVRRWFGDKTAVGLDTLLSSKSPWCDSMAGEMAL